MTEEGYEVMGPGGGANPAIPAFPAAGGGPSAPPPPSAGGIPNFPTAAHSSAVAAPPSKQASATDNMKAVSIEENPSGATKISEIKKKTIEKEAVSKMKKSKKPKKKSASDVEESRMSGATEGPSATQRPNSCDTCQLALIIFLMVLVIAIAIPVMLTATKSATVEFISNGLFKND